MLPLWFGFWNDDDWYSGSSAASGSPYLSLIFLGFGEGAEPEPPEPGASDETQERRGGGHKKHNNKLRRYERIGEDFWLVRERYLRRYTPPIERAAPVAKTKETHPPEDATVSLAGGRDVSTTLLEQALAAATQRAHTTLNPPDLQEAMQRVVALALDISQIQQQNYDRAIAVLLLDVF